MKRLAIDIGYSNLKLAFGPEDAAIPETRVLPGAAGPADRMPDRMTAGGASADYAEVTINDAAWVAGVEASRLQQWERDLHEDFPASDTYRALFYAGLLYAGAEQIDHLVTGLPVSQARDATYKAALAKRLTGTHAVTPKKSIAVKRVTVIPQPIGAYLDLLHGDRIDPAMIADAMVLVIDPGFFSVDWVPIIDGEARSASAGTSVQAMSYVLEALDRRIRGDHGIGVGRDRLEQAVRKHAPSIMHQGQKVDLAGYFAEAAEEVAGIALTAMRQSLRSERSPDIVLMAGGGAAVYGKVAQAIYPKANVLVPEEPVLANVRGYWRYAA
ncbi:MAG: ParM/StbA family protein [Alphaproteobacteria bacterium]|nr:ParM/StbA family protein [Alphaproteobacteria bacterium]